MSFIVAIDGPAGTGKGTITSLISKDYGLVNIDTGAMFRCVTLSLIENHIAIEEEEKIQEILDHMKIEFTYEKDNVLVFLNGRDVSKEIRSKEVNDLVSPVATLKIVRDKLLHFQREAAKGKNVIMEGRDIGTAVFPNADVKIYLDASAEERARRRVKQNEEKGMHTSYEEVLKNVQERDRIDSTREIAPLKKAEDAIVIDSTNMTIPEVEKKVKEIIDNKLKEEKITLEKKENTTPAKIEQTVSCFRGAREFEKPTESTFYKLQRRCVWHILRGFYRLFFRLEMRGVENVPTDGAFIICGNHVDFLKVPVIVLFTPRKVNFIAKAELFNNPILAWLAQLFEVISVKRGKQDVDSMKNSLRVLAKGDGLGLFPEGTRNGLAKNVKVKNGAAFMALRTGKPIVPVGIKVTKGPFSKITLNYGKPLDYSQYQSKTPEKEVLDKVTEELMNTIIDLTNC